MTQERIDPEDTIRERIAEEEGIQGKIDEEGNRWRKVYSGGGAHFQNWLDQCLEVWGEANVEVEEIAPKGFRCYEESGEKMYRIWVKGGNQEQNEEDLF